MDETRNSGGGYNARPSEMANKLIGVEEEQDFTKHVDYYSGAHKAEEARRSAAIAQAATAEYMGEYAQHRPVNDLVKERTGSRVAKRYERDGMTVVCTKTDDMASLMVERRVPQEDQLVDKMTRVTYVLDGPDREAVEVSWLINKDTDERVESDLPHDLDDLYTFDSEHDSVITLGDESDPGMAFTYKRLWEAEDVFSQLADEAAWQISDVEYDIKPRQVE